MTPDVWDDAERLERYVGPVEPARGARVRRLAGVPAGQPLAGRRLRHRRAHRGAPRARRSGRGRRGRPVGGVRRVRRRAPARSPRVVRRRRCAGARPSRRVLRRRRRAASSSTSCPTRGGASPRWRASSGPAASSPDTCGTTPGRCSSCASSGTPRAHSTRAARELDEGGASPCAARSRCEALFSGAGLAEVEVAPDRCADPLPRFRRLLGHRFWAGRPLRPGTAYVAQRGPAHRAARVSPGAAAIRGDGSIRLIARAWAVRGTRPL